VSGFPHYPVGEINYIGPPTFNGFPGQLVQDSAGTLWIWYQGGTTWEQLGAGGGGGITKITSVTLTVTNTTGPTTNIEIPAMTYDAFGAAATAQSNAEAFATGAANTAQTNAEAASMPRLNPTAVKTANYNANAGEFVPCNAAAGGFAVTLPTAPADKTAIGVGIVYLPVTDIGNNVIVSSGGSDVINFAGTTTLELHYPASAGIFIYDSAAAIWYVEMGYGPPVTLGALDDSMNLTIQVTSSGEIDYLLTTGSLDQIATAQKPVADWSNNGHEITNVKSSLGNAAGAVANVNDLPAPGSSAQLGAYGDGSDGAVTFDGVATPVAGATLSGSTYTLTRDIWLNGGTINVGVTVNAAGFRIFDKGTFTNNGTIQNNGNAGSIGTTAGGAFGAGVNGVTYGFSSAAGGAGSLAGAAAAGGAGGFGGNGGAGGAATASGGAGGVSAASASAGQPRDLLTGLTGRNPGAVQMLGGSGGGGGGGSTGNGGGGGGGGGGGVVLSAYKIAGTGTIQANGGVGGAGRATGNTGGGGGGGGGVVVIISSSVSGGAVAGQTVNVTGGTGGGHDGSGSSGSNGSAGNTYFIAN